MLNVPNNNDENHYQKDDLQQSIHEQKNYIDGITDAYEQTDYLDSSINNSYVQNYNEQEKLEELEQNAPALNNPVERNINTKALAFLGVTGLSVAGLLVFAWSQFQEPEVAPQPVEQTVSIPEPELPPLPPPPPPQQNIVASSPAQPITVQTSAPKEVQPISAPPQIATTIEPPIETYQQPPTRIETVVAEQPKIDRIEEMRKENTPLVENNGQGNENIPEVATAQSSAKFLPNRDKLLIQGTYLRCVLETKIVSDIPGFTSCVITEPVYSASGKYLLIPKGSKVLGQYGPSNPASARLAVVWDRLITPDGIDVTLRSPGVDNLGAAGHVGKFQSHWGSRLASALLISMISDVFKYAAAEYGPEGSTETTNTSTITNPYESETANTLKQQAINQLERNNMRPNTVTINQGSLINIYTAQDIDFSGVVY